MNTYLNIRSQTKTNECSQHFVSQPSHSSYKDEINNSSTNNYFLVSIINHWNFCFWKRRYLRKMYEVIDNFQIISPPLWTVFTILSSIHKMIVGFFFCTKTFLSAFIGTGCPIRTFHAFKVFWNKDEWSYLKL